ncbi:Asp-tRNA(Asn)/Glu-tRNA(Gln) amidotransferase subunit GatC [Desulfolucanica intricata]|uniref:Asp-tRNA(Asn)/Glu-tRNA(Gln) amidotransferase subunit GatC n=1 Tax=Desulfolucanica intricata TaxID=1285191 RepID=UPI0008295919|nr:Asp-tRNA(Asn)/Glu-tRNA(Gln) amidotransferase subunit GatC [Desulfolucanica intricata]
MITKADVEHVALLARLKLSEEEKEKYTEQLNAILEYAQKLEKLDTAGVPPTAHVLPLQNIYREDQVGDHLSNEKAIANAPSDEGGYFKVPKII